MTSMCHVMDYDGSAIGSRSVRTRVEKALDSLGLRRSDRVSPIGLPASPSSSRCLLIVGDLHQLARSWSLDRMAVAPPWMSYVLLVRTASDRKLLGEPYVSMQLSDRLLLLHFEGAARSMVPPSAALEDYLRAVVERLRPDRVRDARFSLADGVLWLEFGDGLARALPWTSLSFAARAGFGPVAAASREHGQSVILVDESGRELAVDSAVLRGEVDAGFAREVASRDGEQRAASGARIRRIREARGLSQEQIAARTGIPQESLSRIENGHRDPRLETLRKLAVAFDLDLSELLAEISKA